MFDCKVVVVNKNDYGLRTGDVFIEVDRKVNPHNGRALIRVESCEAWYPLHIFNRVYMVLECIKESDKFKKGQGYLMIGSCLERYAVWHNSRAEYVRKDCFKPADEKTILSNFPKHILMEMNFLDGNSDFI